MDSSYDRRGAHLHDQLHSVAAGAFAQMPALLSLAYSLLARDCTIAAYAVGFDPYIGLYHQPTFGRPALALDLMEEFRPLIADSAVLTAINNRMIRPDEFVQAGDAVNLSAAGRKRFLFAYEIRGGCGKSSRHARIMGCILQLSVFECDLTAAEKIDFESRPRGLIKAGEDQVLFISLGPSESRGERIITAIGQSYIRVDPPCYVEDDDLLGSPILRAALKAV